MELTTAGAIFIGSISPVVGETSSRCRATSFPQAVWETAFPVSLREAALNCHSRRVSDNSTNLRLSSPDLAVSSVLWPFAPPGFHPASTLSGRRRRTLRC